MKKISALIIVFFCGIIFLDAQGTLRGKITDENGDPAIGAAIKRKKIMAAISDMEGTFSLNVADSTLDTLTISWIGYKDIEFTLQLRNNEVVVKDFSFFRPDVKVLKEAEVTAKTVKAKDYYMENKKINSSVTMDYISSEIIKRTGASDASSAVAKVTGVSLSSNGFITIRGIGDRYVKTAINGSRIPTLDPFTNNIKLDLFPAALIDNVILTKTASPDLPGDWAGAFLSVETKDYPDKLSVNIESTVGYNLQSTFKDMLTSQRSSTDWLGYDNGFREHSHTDFYSFNKAPTTFQVLCAVGLSDYYKSLGVTSDTPWGSDDQYNVYYKLGLVQLGLLPKAQFNDPVAFDNADKAYKNGPYKNEAFDIINANAAKTSQSFPNSWNTTTRKAPLDFSQSFSVGNQINLFGKPFGFLGGFRYYTYNLFDPNSIAQRPKPDQNNGLLESAKIQQESRETNGWSALLNAAYKISPNHSVSLLFMPNLIGVNKVRNSLDTLRSNNITTLAQFYEQRKQLIYQYKSEHYIPAWKLKVEANASYTNGTSSAPDFRVVGFSGNGNSIMLDPSNYPADRYYRYLTDKLFDSRLSAELPLDDKIGLVRKIKIGGAYQYDKQTSDQYDYHVDYGNGIAPTGSLEQVLGLNQFEIDNHSMNWYYQDRGTPVDHRFGRSKLVAGFAMADYSINSSLRVSGGLRVEKATIYTDVDKFDSLHYAPGDIRRYPPNSIDTSIANPGSLNDIRYLPSANIVYKLKNSEDAPMNVRFNYSQTVARPSIRELSAVSVFDYELQAAVRGNPDLKIVQVKNYDLRFESYFKNKDNVSLSLFYKDFKNHIELEYSDKYTWNNVDKSYAKGIELEGRKNFLKHFDFRANLTFVKSSTTYIRAGIGDVVTRSMFGQAPYIVNGILSYNADSIKLVAAISYNVQGPRLVIGSNNPSIPDVYELNRHSLDCKVSKQLTKHFSASFLARNILNAPVTRSYKYPEGFTLVYDKYRYGTIFQISLLYKL